MTRDRGRIRPTAIVCSSGSGAAPTHPRGPGPGSGYRSSLRSSIATGAGSSSTGRRSRSNSPPSTLRQPSGGIDGPRKFSYSSYLALIVSSQTRHDWQRQRMTTNDNRSRAVLARDAALTRIRRTRRWVIAGAAALTAGFAALVSAVAPGRSLASKSSVRTEASTGSSSSRACIDRRYPSCRRRRTPTHWGWRALRSSRRPPRVSRRAPSRPSRRRRLRRHSPRRRRSRPAVAESCRGARERTT